MFGNWFSCRELFEIFSLYQPFLTPKLINRQPAKPFSNSIPHLCKAMISIQVDNEVEVRQLTPKDAQPLYKLVEANRSFLGEWMPWVAETKSAVDTGNFIQRETDRYIEGKAIAGGIWYNGELCGTCGFNRIDSNHLQTEIGYWLNEPLQGRGIVSRACQGLINFGFQTFKILRVEIRCLEGNFRSQAIAERLGFKLEGVLRNAEIRHDGIPHNLLIFGLLREEWRVQIWRRTEEDSIT